MAKNVLDHIVIHCSASPYGTARLIEGWHREKGWKSIGYHFVIQNGMPWNIGEYLPSLDGSVENGRFLDGDSFLDENEVGAHALGYNNTSIGICLIGMNDRHRNQKLVFKPLNIDYDVPRGFSSPQFKTLATLVGDLCTRHSIPVNHVVGHCETPGGKGKTCPDFDMDEWRKKVLVPIFQKY